MCSWRVYPVTTLVVASHRSTSRVLRFTPMGFAPAFRPHLHLYCQTPIYVSIVILTCVVNRACFSYNTNLDLTGVVQVLLYLIRDIACQACGGVFIYLFRLDNDSYFAT